MPLSELTPLLSMKPDEISTRVVKSLKLSANGKQFIYVPQELPAGAAEQGDESLSRKQSLDSPSKAGANGTSPKASSDW